MIGFAFDEIVFDRGILARLLEPRLALDSFHRFSTFIGHSNRKLLLGMPTSRQRNSENNQ
jgi:hypothetical protein